MNRTDIGELRKELHSKKTHLEKAENLLREIDNLNGAIRNLENWKNSTYDDTGDLLRAITANTGNMLATTVDAIKPNYRRLWSKMKSALIEELKVILDEKQKELAEL